MKHWMLISALLSTPLFAGFEKSQITNFSGQYVLERGQGHADVWQLPGKTAYQNVDFEIYKEETALRLVHPEGEQIFEEIPEFILNIEKVILNQVQHSTTSSTVSSAIGLLEGFNPQNHLIVEDTKIDCQKNSSLSSEWKKVIDACTTDGTLSISHILIEEKSRSNRTLAAFLKELFKGIKKTTQSDTELNNLKFSVTRNKYKLAVSAKLDIKVNLTMNGEIEYMPHGEKNIIKIKIDKAKAGFLNITDKVFTALEQRQGAHLSVQRPYVYLSF